MTASVSLVDAGPFEKMVSFEISSSDLDQAMNRASRQISRQVNIAGFRPGKAPRRLVESRVGTERIRADALEELVPPRVGEILSETEIAPVVPPLLESVTDAGNGSVRVEVRVTTWPRLESLPDYRGRSVRVQAPPSVSEGVDARLQQLRHMYAPLQTVDRPVEKGDFVVIDMTVMEGERLIESLALDGFSYEVGSERLTARIDEGLLGRQAGDEISISAPLPEWLSPQAHTGEEDAPSDPSDPSEDEPAGGLYEVRIVEVQSRSLPELDDAWASEYTGHDSLEGLREEMSREVETQRGDAQWRMLATETMAEITSELDVELPERLENVQMEALFRNHLSSLERGKTDHMTYLERIGLSHEQFLEGLRRQAVAGLKTRILIQSVIEAEGMVLGDAKLSSVLEGMVQSVDDPEALLRRVKESGHIEQMRSDMLRDRAQAFLAMQVQPVDADGQPVAIEVPSWVKAWFESAENLDTGGGSEEALYEAEVINDPDTD